MIRHVQNMKSMCEYVVDEKKHRYGQICTKEISRNPHIDKMKPFIAPCQTNLMSSAYNRSKLPLYPLFHTSLCFLFSSRDSCVCFIFFLLFGCHFGAHCLQHFKLVVMPRALVQKLLLFATRRVLCAKMKGKNDVRDMSASGTYKSCLPPSADAPSPTPCPSLCAASALWLGDTPARTRTTKFVLFINNSSND